MAKSTRLPAAIVGIGLTSLFTDVGTELIFPLLPVYLASLGASATFIGLVEGAADAVASFLKLGSGVLSDRSRQKKPLVLAGYGIAGFSRPFVALASAPWHVLAVRVIDRVGKGIRTTPRDALIAELAPPDQIGRAFGLHSAMDHAGAMLGPLLASVLLSAGCSLRQVFALSIVPGLAALVPLLLVREPRAEPPSSAAVALPFAAEPVRPPALSRPLYAYLALLFLFSIGNSSDAFLLLRARELGMRVETVPLLWMAFNGTKLVAAYAGGSLSDRVPRVWLIIAGWLVYAGTYFAFGQAHELGAIWSAFLVYGLYNGLCEPAEKALVRDLAPATVRGRAYGAYHFVVGISAIPAGLLTGFLWQTESPRLALLTGAALALVAACGLLMWQLLRPPSPAPA
jgi:MFS family permease